MKTNRPQLTLPAAVCMLLVLVGACSNSRPTAQWTKAKRIAGKEQRLSHLSGLVVDDGFAYVTIGGNIADEQEGMSGLRKVALDSGEVTSLDERIPQSDYGGIAIDEQSIYWNVGGSILQISKDGGRPRIIAADNVGTGIDIALDDTKVYWVNHGYYAPNTPVRPQPIYAVPKNGGAVEVFADHQKVPHSLVVDQMFVYWLTPTGIFKQAKTGGEPQLIYQASDSEGVDELTADSEYLYFGFRGAGESRWALRKISKQGGTPQTLVQTYSLKPVVVDDASVYFFDEDGMKNDALCKVSKSGGEVTRLDTGYASGVITQNKQLVYFGALDDLYSFPK